VTITVHFTKEQGAPVHFVSAQSTPAAAVREVDLQRKYHRPAKELADSVGLTTARSAALRRHLGIGDDPGCRHEFVVGSQRISRFSDTAVTRMRDAKAAADMDVVWAGHRPGAPDTDCGEVGCTHAHGAAAVVGAVGAA
jgi:hypothetical protein